MGGGGESTTPLELAIKLALINFSKVGPNESTKSGINKVPKLKAPKVAF
jgi:hypothetical protein